MILGSKKLTKKDLLKKLTKNDRRDDRGEEEERKRRKERGSGRAKRARWCGEAWEEGRGAKRARRPRGGQKDNRTLSKKLTKKDVFFLFFR